VNKLRQEVTVTGEVDPHAVLRLAQSTGKKAEPWPPEPCRLVRPSGGRGLYGPGAAPVQANDVRWVPGVGLILTDVQRHETKSQPCLISRPDRGRQPTDVCGPMSRCAYTKGGEGLGAHTMKFAVIYFPLPHHPRTDH
jgi:hypothetical protein